MIKLFMLGTSNRRGALSLYHVYGDENELEAWFDGRVGPKGCEFPRNAMMDNELRYGWLASPREGVVDEVMLGKPKAGMRVLMTHGGGQTGMVVERYMDEAGYSRIGEGDDVSFLEGVDVVFDAVLSGCLTVEQASAVLLWRRDGGKFPGELVRTHRVVLAGAPNAGKSSLLNCLSGYERAFVHAEAGATRDVVDELADVGGYAVWLGDLPGFMNGDSGLGAEAWRRAEERLRMAEAVWVVVDGSEPWEGATEEAVRRVGEVVGVDADVLVAINKSDLPAGFSGEPWREVFPAARGVKVCALPDGDAGGRLGEVLGELWGG